MTNEQENNLKKALDAIQPKVRESLQIKEFLVYTIDNEEGLRITRYPFCGTYIEVCLKSGNDAMVESKMRNVIENAIDKKLSCTCSPEMSGCQKAVYRVDFEMQGIV